MRARVTRVAAAVLLAAAPAMSGAQDAGALRRPPAPGFAAIIGIVDDSLRGGPLVGATVVLVGSLKGVPTNRDGVFRLDSVPPGPAQLVVRHPMLDTLGATVTSGAFTVAADKLEEIGFSTPSLARVREIICPRGGAMTGTGMLVGRVDGADDAKPVNGALVSLVYTDPASGTALQRVRSARSREDGLYVICGLPETFTGTVQAAVGANATSEITVQPRAQYLTTASFLMGAAVKSDSGVRGSALLFGRVTDVAGRPLRDAQVAIEGGTAIALTGEDGRFSLGELPSGTTNAVVRKIGFSPAYRTVHLRKDDPQTLSAALAAGIRALAPVTITANADAALKKIGFTDRRMMGARSNFLMPADIEKHQAGKFTDLFRMMNGFRVVNSGLGSVIESTRGGGGMGGQSGCVNIFVDRVAFEQMQAGDLDTAFPVHTIGAVEAYASATDTPAEFRMVGKSCATIVAWSKMRISKP
jgi:hypothetical protein